MGGMRPLRIGYGSIKMLRLLFMKFGRIRVQRTWRVEENWGTELPRKKVDPLLILGFQ